MQDDYRDIRDAARRALAGVFSLDSLKHDDGLPPGLVARVWSTAVEAGWPGLMVPEESGGLGLGLSAAVVIAEELGRSLAPGAWASTLALAPCLEMEADFVGALASGEARVTFAPAELSEGHIRALVDHPETATHHLLAFCDEAGSQRLVRVATAHACVERIHQPFDPGTPVASISVPPGAVRQDVTWSERAFDGWRTFLAAQLVGIARGALSLTLDHARTRVQFAVPIGSFQAIKHRLADIAIATDAAALAVDHAARSWDEAAGSGGLDGLSAYALASRAADAATGACVQIHAGIGVSWEHDAHLYLKRWRSLVSTAPQPEGRLTDEILRRMAEVP